MRILLIALLVICTVAGLQQIGLGQIEVLAEKPANQPLSADNFFDVEHIVDIQIELPPDSWDEIRFQSRDFTRSLSKESPKSPFKYVKGNVTVDGVLIEDVGIRKKGFLGSLDSSRPSLKIKFAEYVDQNPIEGIDRLTLNNNKQDPARYCQYLSYKLFRDSGTVAPRCNFAKVTVNGNYLGIYSNVESIRSQMLARNFGDGDGELWEGTVTDFFPDWNRRFEKKNKKANYAQLEKITQLLGEENLDLNKLSNEINIESFVKFWAMESLIGFWDGYCSNQNNFFLYRNPVDEKLYFIPWGVDSSFSKTTPLPPFRITPRSVHSKSVLSNRLYRIPEIRDLYQQTLMSFLDEHWNEEKLLAEIERLETLLQDELHEDNSDFVERSESYRKFVTWRRGVITREFKNGPPELPSREKTPMYFEPMGTATITFQTEWFEKTPRKPLEVGEVEIELALDGQVVEIEEVGVYAERSKWPSEEKVKPASIVITVKQKSDDTKLVLGLGVADVDFHPSGDNHVEIGGIFILGNSFMDEKGRMRMINGSVKIDEAGTKEGSTVKGSMEVVIFRMNGGDEVGSPKDSSQVDSESR